MLSADVKYRAIGITLKYSDDLRPGDRRRLIAARLFGKRGVVGYYHGFFVYEDYSFDGARFKMYYNSIMKVTRRTNMKWSNRLPKTVADKSMVQHPECIPPASFCAMRYVNEGR